MVYIHLIFFLCIYFWIYIFSNTLLYRTEILLQYGPLCSLFVLYLMLYCAHSLRFLNVKNLIFNDYSILSSALFEVTPLNSQLCPRQNRITKNKTISCMLISLKTSKGKWRQLSKWLKKIFGRVFWQSNCINFILSYDFT